MYMADRDENLPSHGRIVKNLLKSIGVDAHEPRVVHQFLELWYSYVVDMLNSLLKVTCYLVGTSLTL